LQHIKFKSTKNAGKLIGKQGKKFSKKAGKKREVGEMQGS